MTSAAVLDASPGLPIVLTVQGGGSLGVYEAGMTWMLVELFKQDGALPPSQRRFNKLYLAAATGASAGSINALLAATAWCDATRRSPEESLFWKTWIRAGTNTLLPKTYAGPRDWGHGEEGILARTYFQRVAFPTLKAEWESAAPREWRSGCRVPVGATLTRLQADTVQLTPSIRARNVHIASTFDVLVDSLARPPFLSFRARAADRQRPEAGRIMGLPTRRDSTIALDTLFPLFAASSGYPVLFEPQSVSFVADSGIYPCGSALRACNASRTLFVDGGVFDNGPLALGLDLYFEAGLWTPRAQRKPTPFVFYVTPDSRRQLGDRRTEALPGGDASTDGDVGGLSGALTLLGAAVPAAREYEIQSLVRQLRTERTSASTGPGARTPVEAGPFAPAAGDTTRCSALENCFIAPDRWHPLAGDRLSGFGGFLARPFREYDFYVGMYDALVLVARYMGKDGVRGSCEGHAPVQKVKDCIQERLRILVESPPVQIGDVAPCVLAGLYAQEFEHMVAPRRDESHGHGGARAACVPRVNEHSSPADSALKVVSTVSDAMAELMHDTLTAAGYDAAYAQQHCGVEGPLHGMLCSEGLLSVAEHLAGDPEAFAILKQWAGDPACAPGLSPDLGADCKADRWFLRWITNTRHETHVLVKNALKRLDETTPHGPGGNVAAVATVHALSLAFLSASETYRSGPDFGQTSLPERGSLASTIGWELVPSSLSFPLTSAGVMFGWEARYVFHGHFSAVAPFQIAHSSLHGPLRPEENHWYALPGVGLGVLPYPWMHLPDLVSSIRPEVQWWMGGSNPTPQLSHERLSYGITTFLVSNKLRFSAFHQPDFLDKQPTAHIILLLGIHDVNGLAYWIKHLNGH